MCDIEDLVRKITPVLNIISQPFLSKIVWGSFCPRTQNACTYEFCKYKKGKYISRRHVVMVLD